MDDDWHQVRQATAQLSLASIGLAVIHAVVIWLFGDVASSVAIRGVAMIFTILSMCAGLALGKLAEQFAGFSGVILLIPISVAVFVFTLSMGILAELFTSGLVVRYDPLIFLCAAVIWCTAAWCATTDHLR